MDPGQIVRAFDSFKKAYSYDKDDFTCLYGVAYHHPILAESIKLFKVFIEKAPHCHKQYFEAFYNLAFIYIRHYQNFVEAKKYYDKGVEAEKEQLPFIPVIKIQCKQMVEEHLKLWYAAKDKS